MKKFNKIFRLIFSFANKKNFIILFTLVIVKLAISLPIPIFQKFLVDNIYKKNIQILLIGVGVLFIVSLLQIGINILYTIFYSVFNQDINFNFRKDLINKIFNTEYDKVNSFNSSYLINRIYTDTEQVQSFILNLIFNFFSNIITFIFGFGLIITIDYQISLIVFILIFLWLVLYFIFKGKLYIHNFKVKESSSKLFSKSTETINMLEVINKNCSFLTENKKLVDLYNNMMKSYKKYIKTYAIFTSISSSINLIASTFILCFGIIKIYKNQMTLGGLLAINTSISFMLEPIKSVLDLLTNYPNYLTSYNRILEIYNMSNFKNGHLIIDKIDNIKLNNINFSYDKKYIIKNLTYKFKKNSIVAIFGENGSGKTTLINLILRLYKHKTGEIVLNNEFKVEDVDIQAFRKRISIVEQEQRLFNDTIYNNITYNIDNVVESKVKDIIKLVGIDTFISSLPMKLNTMIEENSTNISGGQKQKIAL